MKESTGEDTGNDICGKMTDLETKTDSKHGKRWTVFAGVDMVHQSVEKKATPTTNMFSGSVRRESARTMTWGLHEGGLQEMESTNGVTELCMAAVPQQGIRW